MLIGKPPAAQHAGRKLNRLNYFQNIFASCYIMRMKNQPVAEMEKFFLALADKTRLRLLNLMREGEVNVNSFVEILKESQPKISRHLAFLKNAGIVELRREGKWIHYKLAEPPNDFAALVLRDALLWLDSHDETRGEKEKLAQARGLKPQANTQKETLREDEFVEANIRKEKRRELDVYLL